MLALIWLILFAFCFLGYAKGNNSPSNDITQKPVLCFINNDESYWFAEHIKRAAQSIGYGRWAAEPIELCDYGCLIVKWRGEKTYQQGCRKRDSIKGGHAFLEINVFVYGCTDSFCNRPEVIDDYEQRHFFPSPVLCHARGYYYDNLWFDEPLAIMQNVENKVVAVQCKHGCAVAKKVGDTVYQQGCQKEWGLLDASRTFNIGPHLILYYGCGTDGCNKPEAVDKYEEAYSPSSHFFKLLN